MAERTPILALTLAETRAALVELGAAPVHAERLRRRLLAGEDPAAAPPASSPMPRGLMAALEKRFDWLSLVSARRESAADGSEKHLLRLHDGELVEAVRLPGSAAPSACLSSQVGCAVGCTFCASGLDGVRRNLAGHEILEQVALLRRHGPVRRVVFMGAGEPTHNLAALRFALPILRDEAELGPRHVLVSTVGPPAAIDRLAEMGLKFTLAVSLHAADRATRAELVPSQPQVEPAALLAAADRFHAWTRRSYQVEYVLLGEVNDARADARALAGLLRGRRAHLSLIGWNPVAGQPFRAPTQARVRAFLAVLHEEGISCQLRRTVGAEANAACGQLRAGALAAAAAGAAEGPPLPV
ncbi:MAG TPA: radical SAM protein [Planctomycetota bacterium]